MTLFTVSLHIDKKKRCWD